MAKKSKKTAIPKGESKFDQLMAQMAQTKMFPIDRQPISPMPPSKKTKAS